MVEIISTPKNQLFNSSVTMEQQNKPHEREHQRLAVPGTEEAHGSYFRSNTTQADGSKPCNHHAMQKREQASGTPTSSHGALRVRRHSLSRRIRSMTHNKHNSRTEIPSPTPTTTPATTAEDEKLSASSQSFACRTPVMQNHTDKWNLQVSKQRLRETTQIRMRDATDQCVRPYSRCANSASSRRAQ